MISSRELLHHSAFLLQCDDRPSALAGRLLPLYFSSFGAKFSSQSTSSSPSFPGLPTNLPFLPRPPKSSFTSLRPASPGSHMGNREMNHFWYLPFSGLFLSAREVPGEGSQHYIIPSSPFWGTVGSGVALVNPFQPPLNPRSPTEDLSWQTPSITKTNKQALLNAGCFTEGLEERRREIVFQALQ